MNDELELSEKVVQINRVSKVAKGGRRFSFNALAIVGNRSGSVAIGLGKAKEVPDAVRKAIDTARQKMHPISLVKNGVLPHNVVGKFKSSKVILHPASQGTGLIADEAVRSVLEQAGIHDVLAKVIGSKNTLNVIRATLDALLQLETPAQSAKKRGITLNRLFDRVPAAKESEAKSNDDEPMQR